ncbi:reticulocalbin-2-like isoform X2 [Oratosquilla oratoria]|uniref:reticulocalbin-2-like isoform X2 n=1 Tax=Oratosquilla oratoria TaxID=337810 RepID=UPI003F777034
MFTVDGSESVDVEVAKHVGRHLADVRIKETANKMYIKAVVLVLVYIWSVEGAAHDHHNIRYSQKERMENGARSPRDTGHYDAEGEHNPDFDHESILGSAKDAKEFDSLPPEESKRRLRILLEKMDRNKDGSIDRTELHSWILRSFATLSQEESEEQLDEVDEDADGYVTWEEYIAETYGIHEPEDRDLLDKDSYDEEQKLLKEDRQLFMAADKNLDGLLDEKEFLAFTHPEEHPDMLPIILQQTLEEKDTNKDGVIDFQEYIGSEEMDEIKDTGRDLIRDMKKKFNHYDKNGSGYIEVEEVQHLIDLDEDIAEDEVKHLFASTDDDGDDILSFEEVINHHDIFVGSEATDYGDHLHNLDRFEDEL